ncbi:MAG: BamA/TamA family outer membrane protein [Bacteroidia bacterium]|nr:BamA/TamA family outer membrane protein [Bacteroidia bacterium]
MFVRCRIFVYLLCGFVEYNGLFSQLLHLNIINNADKQILFTKKFSSDIELKKAASDFLWSYYSNGYLLADYDSIIANQHHFDYYFNKNQLFLWGHIRKGNLEPRLYYTYMQNKKFYQQAIRYSDIVSVFEKIIKYYENNGYPFVSVQLDSIQSDSNFLSASLMVNKNQKVTIDSIIIQGGLKVNKKFLYKYIDVFPSSLYNEKRLNEIEKKLKKLPFVNMRQSPIVRITDKYTKVYIFADNKNVSQFDGIIGMQPDLSGKTIVTGNIKIKLMNTLFKNAEILDLDWQRVQALTQSFKLAFSMPYFAGTALGIQYQINLFKKDTSFIDVQNHIGLSYSFSGINSIVFFYKQRNSNIISTYGLSGITTLPDFADIITRYYGTSLSINTLNNIHNPSSGWNLNVSISIGNKDIKKNPKINDLVYKNILLHSLQYQSEGIIEKYFPKILSKYTTLKTAVKYGYIDGNSTLFKNELFRIGGLKSIRGFNEQSIYADRYFISTLEYRLAYSEYGYIAIFSDIAYYSSSYGNQKSENKIYSLGAGIQFDTKAGLFNLFYALGNQLGVAPDFRTGKIHAGLITIF